MTEHQGGLIIAIRMLFSSPMRPSSIVRVGACIAVGCLVGASCQGGTAPAEDRETPEPAVVTARALEVGEMAPDFSLPGSDGKEYSLSTYRGRQTVVLAWFAKAFTEG